MCARKNAYQANSMDKLFQHYAIHRVIDGAGTVIANYSIKRLFKSYIYLS